MIHLRLFLHRIFVYFNRLFSFNPSENLPLIEDLYPLRLVARVNRQMVYIPVILFLIY